MTNFYFKIAPGALALIRKGFTMAQNVPLVIPYTSAVENFQILNFLYSTQLLVHKMELIRFKSAPDVLALIRKGFTMAQNVPLIILYISAFENFKKL